MSVASLSGKPRRSGLLNNMNQSFLTRQYPSSLRMTSRQEGMKSRRDIASPACNAFSRFHNASFSEGLVEAPHSSVEQEPTEKALAGCIAVSWLPPVYVPWQEAQRQFNRTTRPSLQSPCRNSLRADFGQVANPTVWILRMTPRAPTCKLDNQAPGTRIVPTSGVDDGHHIASSLVQ